MKKDFTIHGETLCASQERALMTEMYLQDHFEFRNNVLNGKVEFRPKGDADYRPLTARASLSGGSHQSCIVEGVDVGDMWVICSGNI